MQIKNAVRSSTSLHRDQAISAKAKEIALSLMLPSDFNTPRLRFAYDKLASSVSAPKFITQVDVSAGSVDPAPPIPNGMSFACLTRDPLHALIVSQLNPGSLTFQYNASFINSVDGLSTSVVSPLSANQTITLPIEPSVFYDQNGTSPSYFHPHGSTYYPGDLRGRRAFHLTATSAHVTQIVFAGSAPSGTGFTWMLLKYDNDVWNVVSNTTANFSVPPSFTVSSSGFYALEVTATTTGTAGNLTIFAYFIGTCDCIGIYPIPFLEAMAPSVEAIRINGASLMFSPTCPIMTEAGTFVGVELPPSFRWDVASQMLNFSNNSLGLDSMAGAQTFRYEKGIFAFSKPTTRHDEEFDTPFVTVSSTVCSRVHDSQMLPKSSCLFFAMRANSSYQMSTLTNWPSAQFLLSAFWAVEFVSVSPWFEKKISDIDENMTRLALEIMARTPQFHENPLHWRDIWNFVKQAGVHTLKSFVIPSLIASL